MTGKYRYSSKSKSSTCAGQVIGIYCKAKARKETHNRAAKQGYWPLPWSGLDLYRHRYVIRKDGTIENGRLHWTTGTHAYGDNDHTIGIHLCGNFEIGQPTPGQIEYISLLTAKICEDYGLPVDAEHVVEHCDLRGDTACPGRNLHALPQTIRGKTLWYQQN